MRIGLAVFAAAVALAGSAHAGSQSSNTSSNSSSNNCVVRDRVVDTYCEDGRCTTAAHRRVYREDRRSGRNERRAARYDGQYNARAYDDAYRRYYPYERAPRAYRRERDDD